MNTLLTWAIGGAVLLFFAIRYWRENARAAKEAGTAREHEPLSSEGPRAQHPLIDQDGCIGCGGCVAVCPEGDVLALVNGKAAMVNAHKCIGHGLCAEECPVGAITMVMAKAGARSDLPRLSNEFETSVEGLFIAGELGGLALIKNAINQGRDCVDVIFRRLQTRPRESHTDVFDLIVAGAGPAGISASLRAAELKLKTLTIEREQVGGTVSKYPRQKLVLTSPVDFPLYGRLRKTQISKEELMSLWQKVMERADLNIRSGEGIEEVRKDVSGLFRVRTASAEYCSHAVILAVGRAGTPRKLGVPGEELPHVLYRLIEADHYSNQNILVVGGGDSAVEAAMGLARQPGNRVTLSYRREQFIRLKDRNAKRIEEHMRSGKVQVIFNSAPREFYVGKVVLECSEGVRDLPNDLVWIFAGGVPPNEFLKSAGIAFGPVDGAISASAEVPML